MTKRLYNVRMFWRVKVLTVGAGTRDVFVKSQRFEQRTDVHAPDGFDACFPMGAKIPLDDVILETGGGATNAAVTFSRFGIKTACACRVGDDDNGKSVLAALKNNRVGLKAVQLDKSAKTSYSVILLSGTGHRSILAYRGASNNLDPQSIPWKKLQPKWVYLTSMGGDMKKNRAIVSQSKGQGARIAWNPGNGELHHGLKKLEPLIEQTDILIVNREEAAMLTGQPPRMLDRIAADLAGMTRTALVITDGPHGAYAYETVSGRGFFAPAVPGKRINTTGAGDAFGSALTAAFIKTGNLQTALKAAALNSNGVITHMGAKAGILKRFPTEKELERVKIKML